MILQWDCQNELDPWRVKTVINLEVSLFIAMVYMYICTY